MRSIAFILCVFLTFAISLQIPILKSRELLCLVLSCIIGAGVTSLSKYKILDFDKVTVKWIYNAFILGLLYGCIKFYAKYYILDHVMGSSKETDIKNFIETLTFIVIIIPLLEEFFFRGILFDDIKRMLGNKAAILLTSILFITLHIKNFSINPMHESVLLMLPGVFIYVHLKLKTNNFLVSYVAHLTHNLTVFLFLLFLAR
ncbi:lysostaphin resistance A-like protein [Gallaecimonas sp. GXIMD1310]|uniref:CPBP family intramembrane glutamic endopeptidase n=1 Tax=Gallaecimonas sp. GXIMD1310 TaxID=3131926 RepID=UPI003254422B